MAEADPDIRQAVGRPVPHDSAVGHVSGAAIYADDLPQPPGLLHLAFGQSARAHARIVSLDLAKVREAPGVVAVYIADDIPGRNSVGPVAADDLMLADGEVYFVGQPIFLVAATSPRAARMAAKMGEVSYKDLPHVITVADALAAGSKVEDSQVMARGDATSALADATHRLTGSLEIGGQEHFYLEGQVAQTLPGEGDAMHVISSTQHPSEVQHLIAHLLGVGSADITVELRRMGGGFGGKETQAALFAGACALTTWATGRPARFCADRDDDMVLTGKRHDFTISYDVGFDDNGMIEGINIELASRCGATLDLSSAINDRAMFHADNCYYLPAVGIVSHRLRTNTVSNTAFRGFGGPQGMIAIERVIDEIAAHLRLDPLTVRQANLYGPGRDITPYHMQVEDNVAPAIMEELAQSANYTARREAIAAFNAQNPIIKKGIALTPVKFGISFTTKHLNQAGALINLYADGTILVNHGGTEMGQGLMIKVAQVVAEVFGISAQSVRISATRTDKVPNTSATAASSGSDLNGMAAREAALTIKARLIAMLAEQFDIDPDRVHFSPDGIVAGEARLDLAAVARMAHIARISLSATGFYATPKLKYERSRHAGRPFYYFAYGAAVSEVAVDTLTGEHKVLAVDILHDVGKSLNPAIDLGQIEGGFIQGMGWLTTEELVFAPDGRLLTHAPATYKIPVADDRPGHMTMALWSGGRNVEETVHRSKAVGEPPFMLAISVFSALSEAIRAAVPYARSHTLDAPATPERVLAALAKLRSTDA